MLQTIEKAICGMQPQQRPKGVIPIGWLPIGLVSDAPGYRLYRERNGALWVQVKLGMTGDECWYGPIPKDDRRHAELMDAAKCGTGIFKSVRSRLGKMIGRGKSGHSA